MEGTAAARESRDHSGTECTENVRRFGKEVDGVPRVEETGSVEREVPTEVAVQEVCLLFAKIALRLVNRKARRGVENVSQLASDANFDAGYLCRHMKRNENGNRVPHDSKYEKPGVDEFTKEMVTSESGLSVSGAVLYKIDLQAILQRRVAVISGQNV